MRLAKKILKKFKTLLNSIFSSIVYYFYYNSDINDRLIFVESRNGKDLAGNILRLLIEIKKKYGNQYKMVVATKKEFYKHLNGIINHYQLNDVMLVKYERINYFKYLSRAKYLINDTTFPFRFIKKKEQIYINTWHGTPFKKMGFDSNSDRHLMDNVQRNLLLSDYLVLPSKYCKDVMTGAYSMNSLYKGKILYEGYPRNTVFFDDGLREKTISKYHLEGKKVYVYMPTYRDYLKDNEKQEVEAVKGYLSKIDETLCEKDVFFVKLHYFVQLQLDFENYKHIRAFPQDIETYEFLNVADVLITDYSSVFYDFACSRKKIILFKYDEDEYYKSRGVYEQPVDFPFPVAKNISDLINELKLPKNYNDDDFVKTYCPYDSKKATEAIVEHVFENAGVCEEESLYNGKENVFVYAGDLGLNGITTSFKSLMNTMQDNSRNYFLCYSRSIIKNHIENLENLPGRLNGVFEFQGRPFPTFLEAVASFLYFKLDINNKWTINKIDRLFKRESIRAFQSVEIGDFIHFSGYERIATYLFMLHGAHKTIFVHNDISQELIKAKNRHALTIKRALVEYDCVAIVSEDIRESTISLSGKESNVVLVENTFDYKEVIRRSNEEIKVQEKTVVSCYINNKHVEVNHIEELKNPEYKADLKEGVKIIQSFIKAHNKLFINIGRYSIEKGQNMLIEAFNKYHKESPGIGLIIIGGYGAQYDTIANLVASSDAREDILLIKAISNPMPILKQCDLFILSSIYEGLGLVLMEADTLGVSVISTDVVGPSKFMKRYGGYLVDCSTQGIYQGMKAFEEGKINRLTINYEEYNSKSLQEFEGVLRK